MRKIEQMHESLQAARRVKQPQRFQALLDKDYKQIEQDLLGSPSLTRLSPTPDTPGNPSALACVTKSIRAVLKRFKGIYSLE